MVVFLMMAMVAFCITSQSCRLCRLSIGCHHWFSVVQLLSGSGFYGGYRLSFIGAAFASLAVLTKTEVTSLIMGGLFIAEALSVIIQVLGFKSTGKRVFLMAPLIIISRKKAGLRQRLSFAFGLFRQPLPLLALRCTFN
jgi:phospho-N-acetylmuramoyl-pentapeptide-transferase